MGVWSKDFVLANDYVMDELRSLSQSNFNIMAGNRLQKYLSYAYSGKFQNIQNSFNFGNPAGAILSRYTKSNKRNSKLECLALFYSVATAYSTQRLGINTTDIFGDYGEGGTSLQWLLNVSVSYDVLTKSIESLKSLLRDSIYSKSFKMSSVMNTSIQVLMVR